MKIFRKTLSLLLVFCFIYTLLSTLGLEISPRHKEALAGWSFMGMSKPVLKKLHEIFGYGFLGLSVFHIWLNIKPITAYLKRAKDSFKPSAAAITATAISSLVFVVIAMATISSMPQDRAGNSHAPAAEVSKK